MMKHLYSSPPCPRERVIHQSNFYTLHGAVKQFKCPVTMQVIPSKDLDIFDDEVDDNKLKCHIITAVGMHTRTSATFMCRYDSTFTMDVTDQCVYTVPINEIRSYKTFEEAMVQQTKDEIEWIVITKEFYYKSTFYPVGEIMQIKPSTKNTLKRRIKGERKITCMLFPSCHTVRFPLSWEMSFTVCSTPEFKGPPTALSEVCHNDELPCIVMFPKNTNDLTIKNMKLAGRNIFLKSSQSHDVILICRKSAAGTVVQAIPKHMNIDVEVLHGEVHVAMLNPHDVNVIKSKMVFANIPKAETRHQKEFLSKLLDGTGVEFEEESEYYNVDDLTKGSFATLPVGYEKMNEKNNTHRIKTPQFLSRETRMTTKSIHGLEFEITVSDHQYKKKQYSDTVPYNKALPLPPSEELPLLPSEELTLPPSEELTLPPSEELTLPPSEELPLPPSKELPLPPSEELPLPPSEELPVENYLKPDICPEVPHSHRYLQLYDEPEPDATDGSNAIMDNTPKNMIGIEESNFSGFLKSRGTEESYYQNTWEYEEIHEFVNDSATHETVRQKGKDTHETVVRRKGKDYDYTYLYDIHDIENGVENLSVDGVSFLLQHVKMQHLVPRFLANEIDGLLLVDLDETALKSLHLTTFEARKLYKFVHGWRANCVDGSCSNKVSVYSVEKITKFLKDIKMNSFAEFCQQQDIDGTFLLDLLLDDNFLVIMNEHNVKLRVFDRVRLKKIVCDEYAPKY